MPASVPDNPRMVMACGGGMAQGSGRGGLDTASEAGWTHVQRSTLMPSPPLALPSSPPLSLLHLPPQSLAPETYLALSLAWYNIHGDYALQIYTRRPARARTAPASRWRLEGVAACHPEPERGRFPEKHTPKIARILADFAERLGTWDTFTIAGEHGVRTGATPAFE
ncbi:hypothetical protein EDB84DRAFT_1110536 [Lactarius hengduanensis]|nr:hypothetical protein EDB84DRAFT_1110536 [Lactarius hengduanensis]KAH9036508.1 hypothetical protein EDB85DRAFT_761020 [Lactarius pseudohatsudake]